MFDPIIIGNGTHVRKKILPSLFQLGLKPRAILSRHTQPGMIDEIETAPVSFAKNIIEKINSEGNTPIIIVATPPSSHRHVVKSFFNLGIRHFIVEKPAVLSSRELDELRGLKDCSIQTINMFEMSPVWDKLVSNLKCNVATTKCIQLRFTIPYNALTDTDFRTSSRLDGGALADIGYYPLAALYLLQESFLGSGPIQTIEIDLNKYRITQSGKFRCLVSNHLSVYGHWGLADEYKNEGIIETLTDTFKHSFIFSKPKINLATVERSGQNGNQIEPITEVEDQYTLALKSAIQRKGRDINDKLHDFICGYFEQVNLF